MTGEARYLPIAEHGLIGDLRTVALVGPPAGRSSGSDHYLGKEAVQNILVFRFANSMVERAWCGEAVDHVQITVAESAGIERRGRHFEEAGALRDMVQNHLLQVLAFVAMEPPDSLAPEDVRDRKAGLLEAVRPFSPDEIVRGSTEPGWSRDTRCRDTGTRNGSRRSRPSRRSWRCAPGSTTRDRLARAGAPALRGRGDRAPAGAMAGRSDALPA